jgi:hypothetical protein
MKDKPEIERRSGYGDAAAIPGLKQNYITDRVADNRISDLNMCETAPAANTEWILMGIPLDRYEAAQQHIAALEAMAGVTVKKSTA